MKSGKTIKAGLFPALALLITFAPDTRAQNFRGIRGIVTDVQGGAIENAAIQSLPSGKTAFSDTNGFFQLNRPSGDKLLIAGAAGFLRDTLMPEADTMHIVLKEISRTSGEILISENKAPGQVDFRKATLNVMVDRNEMRKAACCNLSESFETSLLADVSFPDPVSGIRQIQMLGLGGKYTGYSIENQISPSGVMGVFYPGLIPGPWLESIQVQKGIAPVTAGPDLLTGQINTNFPSADTGRKILVNAFFSNMGRAETNLILPIERKPGSGTQLFLHGSGGLRNMDVNGDGYREMPLGHQMNGLIKTNRKFGKNGSIILHLKAFQDERIGGDVRFRGNNPSLFPGFGYFSSLRGVEFYGKAGKVFPGRRYLSAGIPWSAGIRDNRQMAGINSIGMSENWFRIEPLLQADLGSKGNGIKAGLIFSAGIRKEQLLQTKPGAGYYFTIPEQRAGMFAEGTFVLSPGLILIAGSRLEWHNFYGVRHSPRMHVRYENTSGGVLRVAAGQAWQDPQILADNLLLFFSGRTFRLTGNNSSLPYGLSPEKGRSMNVSYSQNYRILPGKGSILIDAFANRISQQVIADTETPGELHLYNSPGQGHSEGIAIQADQKIGRLLALRLAYRYAASRMDYLSGTLSKPLWAFHRAFIHADLSPGKEFYLNASLQLNGAKRLYGGSEMSPFFPILNLQISKKWSGESEISLGCENLSAYRQKELILFPGKYQDTFFDAARVWGPAIGRMWYLNLRWFIR